MGENVSMDLIKSYEQQFGNLAAEVTAKISELSRCSREGGDSAELDSIRKTLKNSLAESKEVLEQYELEIRESPSNERQKLNIRHKSYSNELQRLENEFRETINRSRARVRD